MGAIARIRRRFIRWWRLKIRDWPVDVPCPECEAPVRIALGIRDLQRVGRPPLQVYSCRMCGTQFVGDWSGQGLLDAAYTEMASIAEEEKDVERKLHEFLEKACHAASHAGCGADANGDGTGASAAGTGK